MTIQVHQNSKILHFPGVKSEFYHLKQDRACDG